jgi:lactoylglutathione lyase
MVKNIAHIALEISNLQNSVDFYVETLGLEYKFDSKDENDVIKMVYLKVCDGVFIEMFPSGIHKPERKHYLIGFHHLCFEVEDIHKAAAKIEAKGYVIKHPVKIGGDGSWQFWVDDPDGNPIEFMQYTETSLQMK